jgi:hypothetical protein
VTQALLMSALLCFWVNHPEKKWLNWVLGIAYSLCILLPLLGLLAPKKRRGRLGRNRISILLSAQDGCL